MAKYVLKRVLSGILTLFIILTLVFFMMRIVGGNPTYYMLDDADITPEEIEYMTHEYGFDRPIIVQYADYLWGILHGDWGQSYFNYVGVFENLKNRWEPTLLIAACSLILMVVIGIPAGIISATHRNSPIDYGLSTGNLLLQTIPAFWLGLMMIYILAFTLHLFPLQGYHNIGTYGIGEALYYVAMPSLALAASYIGGIARQTRSSFLGVMKEDYVRTAKAKGLPRVKILYKHALKNSVSIISSMLSANVAGLVGGSVVVEKVFGIEGIGKLALDSLSRRDYSQQQACVVACALIYIVVNILQDIFYKWLDPRIDFTN